MTDLEITKLCAEAMGFDEHTLQVLEAGWTGRSYDPLHDDEQAMALAKRFNINVTGDSFDGGETIWWSANIYPSQSQRFPGDGGSEDQNRAICECVAKMVKK